MPFNCFIATSDALTVCFVVFLHRLPVLFLKQKISSVNKSYAYLNDEQKVRFGALPKTTISRTPLC